MESIFEVIGKVVLAVGGAGAIIIAVSSYISKGFANWFLQKEKAKYEKEIEEYKNELSKEIEILKNANEKALFTDKMVFEYEYEIIIEIIPIEIQAYDNIFKTLLALTVMEKDIEKAKKLVNISSKSVQVYYDTYIQYAVFLPEEIYSNMQSIYTVLIKYVSLLYDVVNGIDCREGLSDIAKRAQSEQKRFLDDVRNYYRK